MADSNESFEQQWRRRFERFAASREDDAGIAGWSATGLALRFNFFRRRYRNSGAGKRWLDAGCGAGTYSRFLAGQAQEVVGLDYAQRSLVKAKERSPEVTRWLRGDVTALPLRSASFDGVISYGVMQALGSSGKAVEEMVRVLRPGGEIWIDALNSWSVLHLLHAARAKWTGKPMLVRYESPKVLRKAVAEAGCTDVGVEWVPIAPAKLRGIAASSMVCLLVRVVPFLGALSCHAFLVRGRKKSAEGPDGGSG